MPALSRTVCLGAASRATLGVGSAALLACSTLIDLDELKREDCGSGCAATTAGSNGGASSQAGNGGVPSLGGTTPSAGKSNGGSASLGGTASQAGSNTTAGTGALPSEGGAAGSGQTGPNGVCPGGPKPPAGWKEHWTAHSEALSLRDFDDCVAIYVDADMAAVDTAWLTAFASKAWTYNLDTYGSLGSERLFVILHQNKNLGGQVSAFYDATRDGRNTLDLGASSWQDGDYELVGTQLSALVERTAVPGKQGAPASAVWGAAGFAQIYKYDLFLGLGMNDEASAAWDAYEPVGLTYPVPGSYWFSDFFFPCWQGHGKTALLVKFFGLLEQYYPASNQVMPPMNFGQYVHFMSGAAGAEVKTQATYAFGWDSAWEAQLQQARSDFPTIKY